MHGEWMCLLNEISQFNSVKHTVQLQVGVKARLSWKVVQGYDGRVESDLEGSSPTLHLTEGEEVKIVCVASEGFPLMQFSWEHLGLASTNQTRQRSGREYQVRSVNLHHVVTGPEGVKSTIIPTNSYNHKSGHNR